MKLKDSKVKISKEALNSRLSIDEELQKKFLYSPAVTARQYFRIFGKDSLPMLTEEDKNELFDIVKVSIYELKIAFKELKRGDSFRTHPGYKAIVSKLKELHNSYKLPLTLVEVSNFCEYFGIETGAAVQDFGFHLITPLSLSNYVKQYVVGQDEAIKAICSVFYTHLLRCNKLGKEVDASRLHRAIIGIIGPTGIGKTYTSSLLSSLFGLPFVSVNISSCVRSGIVGSQVDTALTNLLLLSNESPDLARQGIVVYDEFDKIGMQTDSEFTSTNLQSELLSIIDGKEMEINDSHQKYSDRIRFKTDNLCLVFCGAFQGIELMNKRGSCAPIGFYKPENTEKPFQQYSSEQLIAWGLMPEFVGRLSAFAYMKPLGEDDIKTIITKAKNTALSKYYEFFKVHDCELVLTSQAIGEIAKVVSSKALGARYLSVVLDAVLREHTFHAPDYSGKTINITAEDILKANL